MLNKNQSKPVDALKSLLIGPFLALFLFGFNTETVYQFQNEKGTEATKKMELRIDKDTSDEDLMKMKADLAKEDIDFSYTIVRNDNREIIDISVEVTGTGENGAQFKNSQTVSDSDNGIAPLIIYIDLENNMVSMGTKGDYHFNSSKIKSTGNTVWISSGDEHKEFIIKKVDGKEKIFINGKEVDRENAHENTTVFIEEDTDTDKSFSIHVSSDEDGKKQKKVKVKKRKGKKDKKVMIIKDADKDSDIEVIGDEGFFFIDNDGKEPLYIIDGKQASKEVIRKLSSTKIATINVLKGESAKTKYGSKAKNGVVEITLEK